VGLTDDDVREILRIVADTPLAELSIETSGFSLYVRRAIAGADAPGTTPGQREGVAQAASPAPAPRSASAPPRFQQRQAATEPANGLVTIQAPMLGTFYRAEGPGSRPFVEVGSAVGPDTTVCIIEVMKMMNSVPAGLTGTVVEICQENAQLVEYGQPLFRVRPA
jgi:acetyl-CoA carboxylase biotin carboxyl carrier protein